MNEFAVLIVKKIFDFAVKKIKNRKIKKIKVLIGLLPTKTIATFFGIGYFPEWQSHWASLVAILITILIVYAFIGPNGSVIELSIVALITAIIFFFIGLIFIYLFQLKNPSANDEIMIHIVFGQIFVLSLSAPAIIAIGNNMVNFNDFLCEKFLYCAPWFYKTITYVPIFAIPYISYRVIDTFKPWPASIFDRDYNTATSNMLDGLINALYTLLFLYLIAFMFFSLTMDEALLFFHGIIDQLMLQFYKMMPEFYKTGSNIVKKLNDSGIIDTSTLQEVM
ncbi:MAG: phosphatidylglycerophosphatase A [Rickettsiaceae bacterium H1]|nr:phosphatidylglycerophosphatase A [Rickettsiaceae bacterium H1]